MNLYFVFLLMKAKGVLVKPIVSNTGEKFIQWDSVIHMIIGGVQIVFLKQSVLFFRLFLKLLMISFASSLILLTQISLLEAA